jgi:F-type H+-transporting ATPase subunit delta
MTDQAQGIAKTILTHLKSKGESKLVSQVVDILMASPEYRNAKSRVVLTSAVKLDGVEKKGIMSYLEKNVGKDYELTEVVDSSLVAGFTLQINDTFIDASVLGKINMLSHTLTAKD